MDPRHVVYRHQDGLYINLTNRCPTACSFCAKFSFRMLYRGLDLGLQGGEPEAAEILARARAAWAERPYKEAVFCGYGESTYRLEAMLAVCSALRAEHPDLRLRLNTVGLADLLQGRPVAPLLRGHLDAVFVSLNTADPLQWLELMRPQPAFRAEGFRAVQSFIRACVEAGLETTATAVALPGVDLEACGRLAASLGARFQVRPLLEGEQMRPSHPR